ncbi:hypothetical protein [Pseudomonas zeae]|uniref:hypothetical protein n=1 Tax=Pseudomonas zeae TaxID=2745510 RepID=UPI001CEC5209|nr:hypothetical protein [Pseudomonas zeae]
MTSDEEKDIGHKPEFKKDELRPSVSDAGSLSNAGNIESGGHELRKPDTVQVVKPDNLAWVEKSFNLRFILPMVDGVHQVWIYVHVVNEWAYELSGEWFNAEGFHDWEISSTLSGIAQLSIRWRYGSEFSDYTTRNYFITSEPIAENIQGTVLSGSGGELGECVPVLVDGDDTTVIGQKFSGGGNWRVNVSQNLPIGYINVFIRQSVSHNAQNHSRDGKTKRILNLTVPKLTSPSVNETVGAGTLLFKGTGHPGLTLQIVRADNHSVILSDPLETTTVLWEMPRVMSDINSGELSVKVKYQHLAIGVGYTDPSTFMVVGWPRIPKPVFAQDQSFVLEGDNGLRDATIVVYLDLTTSLVGVGRVSNVNGSWSVSVAELPPGPVSLVAEQVFQNVPSGRGEPRAFRIRPPQLEIPEVTFLPDSSLKFSGNGHFDQNLRTEIQFSASNGSLPLPPNVRVDGQGEWETAPVVWPLGSYDVTVIQKIADNANGWIESQPLEFKVHNNMPDITEASYTEEYLPVFSGKGYTGATVSLRFPDTTEAARSVVVVNGQWSTPALVEWGPTKTREVRITQHLGDHSSQRPFSLHVTIPPLAPGLDDPSGEGLEPIFSGTCWSGAVVKLRFSDDGLEYEADVEGERWAFQRTKAFEPGVLHRVTVTQIVVDLPSVPASKTFTVHRVMLQPLIVAPVSGTEVGYDVTIEGDNGMQGAMMQLHDSQMGRTLGAPLELLEEGKWSIELRDLELRPYFLHAQQILNGQESTNSAVHELKVVVPPPRFTTPIPGGKAPRTSKIAGTGRTGARVEVWLEGATEPLLTDIEVNASDNWEAEVSLPVGITTIWAFQTFVHNGTPQRSQPNERLRYKVVPATPFIETPTADDHVGRRVVVSGFATPGDTVTVTLGSDQASAEVRENRTWSVTLKPGQNEGNHELEVVAAYEGFESDSAKRTVQLATYLPTIEIPAPGRWVSNPVLFAGTGRQGVGVLVDPFNPDKTWAASIQVDPDWQGLSDQALPLGGNWCRFKLQPSDSDPLGSDWIASERFEIESAPTDKSRL